MHSIASGVTYRRMWLNCCGKASEHTGARDRERRASGSAEAGEERPHRAARVSRSGGTRRELRRMRDTARTGGRR